MLGRLMVATGMLQRLRRAWKQDVHAAVGPMRRDIARLLTQIEALRGDLDTARREAAVRVAAAERDAAQVRLTVRLNEQHREVLARLPQLLESTAIIAHVQHAIAQATLHLDPFPHIVVDGLLPEPVYRLMLKAIPPAAFFGDRDPIKQNLRIPLDFGPSLTTRVWNYMDGVIARDAIRPAVMRAFEAPLRAHIESIFGSERRPDVERLPQAISGGRVMLRRPGYHLAPHRDPKRSLVTCLLYLAYPGDDERYGTGIYRVDDDHESSYAQTYYPEQDGRTCELVKTVPFRPNTMLAFVNCGGAHGATIPRDAPPKLERFSYQFYIGPDQEALEALVATLPPERRQMWADKPR